MPRGNFQWSYPCGEPLPTQASTGGPPTLAGSFDSVPCRVTAPLLWVLVHTKFCFCPPRLKSLLPPVFWKPYNQIPLALKARCPGDSQAVCWVSRVGNLMWGSESLQQWENFFSIIVLLSVDHPPGGYRIWFYPDCTPPTVLLWLFLCLWMWGIVFWWVLASSCQWLFKS